MICNESFIVAYNKLFTWLYEHEGIDGLREFWTLLAEAMSFRFEQLTRTKGLAGLVEYWAETLSAEKAACTLKYTMGKNGACLTLYIRDCPSRRRLHQASQSICPVYCDHCKTIYGTILSSLGYSMTLTKIGDNSCLIQIRESACSEAGDTPGPSGTSLTP
ncbi:MAG: hypothetical protein M0Q27_03235 [Candidatus Colwellbacteria bacterium]|jgi:hypothetical protein|nr:hypothetical protein [Candidatus Colwellbacteria bacterium]